jgi:hypothetical protein
MFFFPNYLWSQNSTEIIKIISYSNDTIKFDTLSIYAFNFKAILNGSELPTSDYYLDPIQSKVFFYNNLIDQKIRISYYYLPINVSDTYFNKNDSIIILDSISTIEPYIYSVSSNNKSNDLFGESQLNKQGSISRGVTVGNAQNLSLQSTLNLQLNGKIGPDLYLKGAISDDNIPFQPEGNTQKLQEFDQVYMQIYNEKFAVIGGDFWLKKPTGYFLNYNKRTQGLSIETYQDSSNHKVSAAYSKGKFARNVIQGVEGNQGPYKLTGAENEQFIIVLAGTEKVFIDGELLKRGQEFDYIVDYNTAQITFTSNRLVTKDKRIIVEFQYSDLNYARSLFAYNANFQGKKYKGWVNYYSEQDSKNTSIQQELSLSDKNLLGNTGDSLNFAFSNSIDSIEFTDSRVLYALIDSLGYDSVLVFSVNPDSAYYQANFKYLGDGNANYILDQFTANGKVYKWIEPLAGVPQGNYEPIRLLVAPQRKQMLTIGGAYELHSTTISKGEIAFTDFNKNTFSKLHSEDDRGIGIKLGVESIFNIDSLKGLKLMTQVNFEYNHENFIPIQWFRSTEFDRDWNVRNKNFTGYQIISNANIGLLSNNAGSIIYKMENLIWGDDYAGWKNNLVAKYKKNNYNFNLNGSWLLSDGLEKTDFLRHNIQLSRNWKKIKIGVEDKHEKNQFFIPDSNELSLLSYQFYDVKTYISSADSSINKYELYYQQRYDWSPDSTRLKQSAVAQNYGVSSELLKNRNNIIKLNVNYRVLNILDTNLINIQPENTILGRVENHLKAFKGLVTSNTYYELGSGLELKKEFIYLLVNPGQGAYSWNDYDNDGVKDIDEFEIAQFADQAEYIRVFLPTNEYVRTYSNQFSQTIFLKPERIWRNKKGLKKQIARFSNQLVFKVNRKTNYEEGANAFNPFTVTLSDSSLISTSSTFRNTFYFNRINSKFGMDYTYQENGSKILLSNGFDSRLHTFNKIKIRWNITKAHTFKIETSVGRKKSKSDYSSIRTYYINYQEIKPVYSFQPNSKFRISLNGKYTIKINSSDLMEEAQIKDVGIEFRFNQPKKGSFLTQINLIQIAYNATNNSSLAYEMLEGLKTGNNFMVGLSYQRKVAKNLQLNFNYNGRKSENNAMIHSGGMELRAFF